MPCDADAQRGGGGVSLRRRRAMPLPVWHHPEARYGPLELWSFLCWLLCCCFVETPTVHTRTLDFQGGIRHVKGKFYFLFA